MDSVFTNHDEHTWHSMRLIALDGSKFTLPRTNEIIEQFDPRTGLQNTGKGHFPMCLVVTAYDVLKEIPLCVHINPVDSSERSIAQEMTASLPPGAILLLDRGFPSFKYQLHLHCHYKGHYLMRSTTTKTFSSVINFLQSGLREQIITIKPTRAVRRSMSKEELDRIEPLVVRALRVENPDGRITVLLTNLLDTVKFPYEEIVDLYFKRWRIELHYRNEKCIVEIEKFHTRSVNGIKQEFYSAAIVLLIARMLTYCTDNENSQKKKGKAPPQFKNAIMCFALYAAIIVPEKPEQALIVFGQLIETIKKVRAYKHRKVRPPQPRICRKTLNRWCMTKGKLRMSTLSQ